MEWNRVDKVFQISLLNFIYSDPSIHKDVLTHFVMQSDDGVHLGYIGEKQGAYNKAIETARNFLKMGLEIDQVAEGTGLSVDELKKIIDSEK